MKRNLCMVLAGLLVLVMASPLYAQPDIKVFGQIRTRLRYWVNIDLDKRVTGPDRRYFDNRTRLGVDAKLADGVRAVVELEKYFDFGSVSPNGVTTPQQVGGGNLSTLSDSAQDPYFRQAWIDFAVPGLQEYGTRFQAGRSFFRVGHGFIWGNSLTGEDGFTLYGPLGPGNFKARFAQTLNQSPATGGRGRFFDNEVNQFAFDYKFPVAEKQNLEIYFVGQADKAVDDYTTTVQSAAGNAVRHGDDYWIGVAYDGVAGPVGLKAEGVYQFGKTRRNACLNALGGPASTGAACATTGQDIDRRAFFLYGEATYKVIPAWDVAVAITFASGDDNANDDKFKNFVAPLSEWTTSPTRVFTDSEFFFGNRSGRAIGNATTNRAFNFWGRGTEDIDSAFSLSDDNITPFSPGLLELEFKTKYAFNPQVTGNLSVIPMWAHRSHTVNSKYLGTEIDVQVGYKPYQNLLINAYAGYFIAGGFFDQAGALLAAQPRQATDNAWVFRTEALVTF